MEQYENAQVNDALWHDMLTEKPKLMAECAICCRHLYSGDNAYEVDGDIYCTDCVTLIELMGDDEE